MPPLLSVTGLAKGTSGKTKDVKKQILRDHNITHEKLTLCAQQCRVQEATGSAVARNGSAAMRNTIVSEPDDPDHELSHL